MTNGRSSTGFTFIDLFAGVGGFHHAMGRLGGVCVQAVELDADARSVYRASFSEMSDGSIIEDIRSLTRETSAADAPELSPEEIRQRVPEHDVLCAGFPCQPFSKSGAQRGVRDRTRGTLFFDVMSIVLARRPEFVILENVRNLAGPRHLDTWNVIVDSLQDAGYRVSRIPLVMSPHLLARELGGAPQSRDRVFVLAQRLPDASSLSDREGDLLVERAPTPGHDPDRWRIEELLDADTSMDEYGIREVEQTWLRAWQYFVQGIDSDTLPGFPIWVDEFRPWTSEDPSLPKWKQDFVRKNNDFYEAHRPFIDEWLEMRWGPDRITVREFPPSRRKFEWQARKEQPSASSRDLDGLVVHFRPSGIRVKPPSYLPALVAITQTSVLGPKVTGSGWRRLSPREASRLQGIPYEGFERSGVPEKAIYKQLGNAVNVGVVAHLASALFEDGRAAWTVDAWSATG